MSSGERLFEIADQAAPSPADPLGGGNELLWQLTGGTETMTVTRLTFPGNDHADDHSDDQQHEWDSDDYVRRHGSDLYAERKLQRQ